MSILIALFIMAILYALVGLLFFVFLVYYVLFLGVLVLIQYIVFSIAGKATGQKFEVVLSAPMFIFETVILIALLAGYTVLPADPIRIDAAECSYIVEGRYTPDQPAEPKFIHPQAVELAVRALDGISLNHTLPTTIRYGYPNLKGDEGGVLYYFFDADGQLLQKLSFHDNLVGVSNTLDGKLRWYNTKEPIALYELFGDAYDTERELSVKEKYGDAVQALEESFEVQNGSYTFTMPDFGGASVNLTLYGSQEVFYSTVIRSSGYEMKRDVKNDTIYYLTEHTEAADWQPGEIYSFTLDDTTYRAVVCKVEVNAYEFQLELPLEEAYRSNRDEPKVNYID